MRALLSLLFLLPLSWTIAVVVAERRDRSLLLRGVTAAWAVLGSLLVLVNEWMPFSGGGDDENYFALAETPIRSLSDAFDLTRFVGFMEQPGYPWLLSILNHFMGWDLLSFKLFNLFLFIVLAIVWYRIGTLLESPTFGRYVFAGVLCLTPLWFYFFVLLKDMSIAVLQSMFLLGVVKAWRRSDWEAWVLMAGATLGVLLFRTYLAAQHVWIVLGVAAFRVFAAGKIKVWFLFLAFLLAGAVLAIGTSPERMAALGIYTEHRVLGTERIFEAAAAYREESRFKALVFPLVYLFIETQAFNPQTWSKLDAIWLRGLLAIPWIALGVPFALLGIWRLWRARLAFDRRRLWLVRLRSCKLVASPWATIVLFALSYLGVSWLSADTTRWRIADMPALATIALAGWRMSPPLFRGRLLVLWIAAADVAFSFFALVRNW
jgi:hypothetical protein